MMADPRVCHDLLCTVRALGFVSLNKIDRHKQQTDGERAQEQPGGNTLHQRDMSTGGYEVSDRCSDDGP